MRAEAIPPADEAAELPRVSQRAVCEATRSLSALLAAGLPLTRALETTRDVAGGPMAPVLDGVLADVQRGSSLVQALSAFPDTFNPLYVGAVQAGERSGRLSSVLERLAGELERQEELRERVLSAAIYPLVLVTLGGASVLLLLFFVVPRFAELLAGAGAELPVLTSLLLASSVGVRTFWPYLLSGTVAAVAAAGAYVTSDGGRQALSRLSLHLPLIGPVRRGLLAGRFARLLAVLLEGGAPLVTGLEDAAGSLGDPAAAEEVERIRSEVRVGTPLHRSVAAGTVFPEELARLVAVGEESGRLAEFLGRAADFYERRSVRAVERLVTLLEPAVIVVFGGIVAVVALALLQAIYGMNAGGIG